MLKGTLKGSFIYAVKLLIYQKAFQNRNSAYIHKVAVSLLNPTIVFKSSVRRRMANMASLSNSGWRDVCDKFKNAQTLSCEESLKDPVNDPYRSKYKARELIREIHCTLKSLEAGEGEEESGGDGREQRPSEAFVDGQRDELFTDGLCGESPAGMLTAKLAAVEFYLGVNHAETEELSAGHEHLMNCVMLLERCRVSSENVSLSIHVRVMLEIRQLK